MTVRDKGQLEESNLNWGPANRLRFVDLNPGGSGPTEYYEYDDGGSRVYHSLTDQSVKFYPFPQYEVVESSSVAAASMEGPTQATASDAEVEALIPPPIPDFLLNTPRPTDEELNATLDVDIGDPPGLQCPFDPLALCDPLLPDASPELADPDPSLAPAPTDLNAPAVEVEETTTLTDSLSGDTTYLPLISGAGAVDAASAEAASQSTTVTKYYFVGGQRVFLKEGGVPRYIHTDHLGSTAIETNLSGQVSAERRYLAFGGERDSSGTLRTENQFTSQKLDGTGLYYYGARYYDPELGQFVSPDTIVPAPGEVFAYNRYMYTYGNPLNYIDPTGHCRFDDDGNWQFAIDCTLEEFDALDWNWRSQWLRDFATAYTSGQYFGNVLGIIEYFQNDATFSTSAWASLSDAGVLLAIQDGQRGVEELAPMGDYSRDIISIRSR